MNVLDRFLGWLSERAERARLTRTAERCEDPRVAADVLKHFVTHPADQRVIVETGQGKAAFTRKDVTRLQGMAKSVGDRVFARTMMGGAAYGFPGTWTADRVEAVQHNKNWIFVAITSIWQRIARHTPNLGFVTDGAPTGTQTKAYTKAQQQAYHQEQLRGEHLYRKSLHAIKPHERLTPASAQHPLNLLLHNPNKHDVSFDFWYELGLFLELTGNSYIWCPPSNLGVIDGSHKPAELWVLPAHWVFPRVGKSQLVEWYEIRPWIGPGVMYFPPEEVIHLKFKSPIHKIDGFSHLTAGSEWIDTQESVNRARFYQFKNGCFPSGNLRLSGGQYQDLDDDGLERMYAKLFARFQGEHRSGLPIITPPESEYVPLTINPMEMAYLETADQLRDMILALWRVPKEIAGIQDAGSEIAMYGPLRQFAENALIPRLTYVGQVLTEKLAKRWDARLRVWWDDPAGEDPAQRRDDIKLRADTGSIWINEIRAAYGDEPWPDGDRPAGSTEGQGAGQGQGGEPGAAPAPAPAPAPAAAPTQPRNRMVQRNGVAHE